MMLICNYFRKLTYRLCTFTCFISIFIDVNGLLNHSWDLFSGGRPPFEIPSKNLFWIAFTHQLVATHTMSVLSMNFDVLMVGYMLQICAQIKMLQLELANISNVESDLQYHAIVSCIRHHIKICRYCIIRW